MRKLVIGACASAMAALLLTFGYTAVAREKGKAAPAAKAAPVAKTEKAAKKPPSACKGLDEAACKAKEKECNWIGEITTKAGKTRKAHCRSKPKSAKKTDAAK